MNSTRVEIREVVPEDLLKLKGITPESWNNPVEKTIGSFLGESNFKAVVAEINGTIAAVGHVIHFGHSSWLGNIIVRDEYRQQGLGTTVTKHLISLCRDEEPVLLVATEMGFRVYRKLGFTTSSNYCFFRGGMVDGSGMLHVGSADHNDYSMILSLDKDVTGEDRMWLLSKHLEGAQVIKHHDNRRIKGFYLPSCGAGVIVATEPEAGLELLKFKLYHHPEKQICIPEENQAAKVFLNHNGYLHYLTAPRMFLNKNITWHPELIFSRISGYSG